MLDVPAIRRDFPILDQTVYGKPLVYLDSAATTQVPECVIARVAEQYRTGNGNVHRAAHRMASLATDALEEARKRVAAFVNAPDEDCIVFTRGATEALNTVAGGLRESIGPGDAVVATQLEHHSNFVPWQQLCRERGADFLCARIDGAGDIDLNDLARVLERRPKVVAVTACSNVTGAATPIKRIARMAHDAGALLVVDGAQAMRHGVVDVQDMECDFFAFSGHKMCAGTGIGALYGAREALERLAPCEFGGEMVDKVTLAETTYSALPLRLEAGTPNYMGAVALRAAMDYLEQLGRTEIAAYEDELVRHAVDSLARLDGVRILGSPKRRCGCVSFVAEGAHPFDLCALVDKMGVALRSGHNCAQPAMEAFGVAGAARLSPAFYNTHEEIDAAVACIDRALRMLRAGRETR